MFGNSFVASIFLGKMSGMQGIAARGDGEFPLYMAPDFQYLLPNVSSHCLVVPENPTSSFSPLVLSESVSSCSNILPSALFKSLQ